MGAQRSRLFDHTPGVDPGWLRVFLPLKNEDFLVYEEEILYDRRFHLSLIHI